MKYPLVTVLMALYNGAEYLQQAVQSVLNQTYNRFEFLIVNDCSTDHSLEIIESFHDSRVEVYTNQKNLGQTSSLNIGLKLAKGNYFARIDADDVALPRWLESQLEYVKNYPRYSVISSYAVAIDEKNKIKKVYKPPQSKEDIILRSLITPPIHHVGSILKKKDILENGGYDERYIYAADYELWEKLIKNNFEITTNPKILVAIREHGRSVSRSEHGRRDLEEIKEIAGRNIGRFINVKFSGDEVSLFCRANYDEGNLTDAEFSKALEVTKRVYMNLVPSLNIANSKAIQWTRKRCTTIYLKRILSSIKQKDCGAIRRFSLKGMKEFGILSIFAVFWTASFFSGTVLMSIPEFYNKILRKKAYLQLNIPPNVGRLN